MTRAERLHHLARRRPGPLGTALRPLVFVAVGLALLLYFLGVMLLAFVAVAMSTVRLVLTAPGALLGRVLRRPSPLS